MADSRTDDTFALARVGIRFWFLLLASCALLSLVLVLPDGLPKPFEGWLAYFVLLTISGLVLASIWGRLTDGGGPRWLPWALVVAIVLRLLVGLGLYVGLPELGYAEDAQQGGYVFYDAYSRDQDAWALGRSEKSLTTAFTARSGSDQYGGLLFVSAALYRAMSAGIHRPLLVTVLTTMAAASALLFTWAFTKKTFGLTAAALAAWVGVLYPEFVLLSASQMREPFMILGIAMGLYGYSRAREGHTWSGILVMVGAAALAGFVSPPSAFLVIGIVALAWVWEGRSAPRLTLGVLIGAALLGLLALILSARAWITSDPTLGGGGLLSVVTRWLTESALFQLRVVTQGSGWAEKIFATAPEWTHMPLATAYGLTQPLLPSALADHTGAPIWQAIAIWRALGWTLLIPLLLYGSVAALRGVGWRRMETFLVLVVWLGILIASYRAAGDQWDNPRYRAIFLAPQAALAGWAWAKSRAQDSPWLARTFTLVGVVLLIFFHWFAGRYYLTPRLDLYVTLGVMFAAAAALLVYWTWADRRQIRRRSSS